MKEGAPREVKNLTLDWTPEQKESFAHMKQVRPDLAEIVQTAKTTLFSAMKHDPHEVLKSRNILNAWGMMPSVFEVKPK